MYRLFSFQKFLQKSNSFAVICTTIWLSANVFIAEGNGQVQQAEPAKKLLRFESTEVHMGVEVNIAAYCRDAEHAEVAIKSAFDEVAKVDQLFSNYLIDSAINRLANSLGEDQTHELDERLRPLFKRAHAIALRTDGAFDYTLGGFTSLWRLARKRKRLPQQQQLKAAKFSAGYEKLEWTSDFRRLKLSSGLPQFDFAGIAKGYAADRALRALRKHGAGSALVDAAGDIAIGDPPPGKQGWKIAIEAQKGDLARAECVVLKNCGIATSGDKKQFVEVDGVRYSHILDPKTGVGLKGFRSVTVIAANATDSDAFASAFNVMELRQTKTLLDSDSEIAVKIRFETFGKQSKAQQFTSKSFPAIVKTERTLEPKK